MPAELTCGTGLAAHSELPIKMGALTSAVADVLELHMKALDLTDESSRQEHDAYAELVRQHRSIGAKLQATGEQLSGYRNLPVARHDEKAMSAPQVGEVFRTFVTREQEVMELLRKRIDEDLQMLAEMERGSQVTR